MGRKVKCDLHAEADIWVPAQESRVRALAEREMWNLCALVAGNAGGRRKAAPTIILLVVGGFWVVARVAVIRSSPHFLQATI